MKDCKPEPCCLAELAESPKQFLRGMSPKQFLRGMNCPIHGPVGFMIPQPQNLAFLPWNLPYAAGISLPCWDLPSCPLWGKLQSRRTVIRLLCMTYSSMVQGSIGGRLGAKAGVRLPATDWVSVRCRDWPSGLTVEHCSSRGLAS